LESKEEKMRVGIVTFWHNRGQGTVGRYLRGIFDSLGHQTFILARPTPDQFERPAHIDRSDIWIQPDVTEGSTYDMAREEYVSWSEDNDIEAAFFFQNYQFDVIAELRAMGVKTIGTFMWERFAQKDVEDAKRAYDVIYSFNNCELPRYKSLGMETVKVSWGCHSELLKVKAEKKKDGIYFFYPAGYFDRRKPYMAVIEAFSKAARPHIRLIVKSQTDKNISEVLGDLSELDPRITVINGDAPTEEYFNLFASCHACVAPSRWEGMGLHLYESIALGMPLITNDNPPMNEHVRDHVNGLLVQSHMMVPDHPNRTLSGIPAYEPDVAALSSAIEQMANPELLAELANNTIELQSEYSWDRTIEQFSELLYF